MIFCVPAAMPSLIIRSAGWEHFRVCWLLIIRRKKSIVQRSLRTCPWLDLALFSWEGTEQEFREFAEKIHGQGACHVLGTMGMKGSLCYNGEEFIKLPCLPCEMCGYHGLGRFHLAAFMYVLLEKGWKKGNCLGGTVIAEAMERVWYSAENCKKDGGFGNGADLQ